MHPSDSISYAVIPNAQTSLSLVKAPTVPYRGVEKHSGAIQRTGRRVGRRKGLRLTALTLQVRLEDRSTFELENKGDLVLRLRRKKKREMGYREENNSKRPPFISRIFILF